ncbi:calcium-binding protein [Acuticoccus sediminis]|uniref:calcium-binding protein n=1 Tax=Acuticoccus sediminis TaxID=2184697 RepID=UPI0011B93F9F|nr:Ig-like domain-containing protein [Acuticoccus sediminis]
MNYFDDIVKYYTDFKGFDVEFGAYLRIGRSLYSEYNFDAKDIDWTTISRATNPGLVLYEGDTADLYVGLFNLTDNTPIDDWWFDSFAVNRSGEQTLRLEIAGIISNSATLTMAYSAVGSSVDDKVESQVTNGYDLHVFDVSADDSYFGYGSSFGRVDITTYYETGISGEDIDNDNPTDKLNTVNVKAIFGNPNHDGFVGPDPVIEMTVKGAFNYLDLADEAYPIGFENGAPQAVDDEVVIEETSRFVTVDVLANDSDPDGDPLAVAVETTGLYGEAVLQDNGTIRYYPGADFPGYDAFIYAIRDGNLGYSGATVTILSPAYASGGGGSDGDDVITLNDAPNYIDAGAGNDVVEAYGGSDTIVGGAGNDSIYGGADADDLYGGDGSDLLAGRRGNDVLTGGAHDDRLYGAEGNDTLSGEAGNDTIGGQLGDDDLSGGDGRDILFGGGGHDRMGGDAGNDRLTGRRGNDDMAGGRGNDGLFGGGGNDTMTGGDGADTLAGQDGNDAIFGGNGADILAGNEGNDTLIGGAGVDTVTGNEGADLFVLSKGTGYDLIEDFLVGTDRFGLQDGLTFADLNITVDGIRAGSDVLAVVSDFDTADLSASDFVAFAS